MTKPKKTKPAPATAAREAFAFDIWAHSGKITDGRTTNAQGQSVPVFADQIDVGQIDQFLSVGGWDVAERDRLRGEYEAAFQAHQRGDLDMALALIRAVHKDCKFIAVTQAGRTLAVARAATSKSQADRRKGKTTLTEAQKRQARREYEAAVVSHGMVKALARKFNVSVRTMSTLLNTPTTGTTRD